jgi:hypothetical protein
MAGRWTPTGPAQPALTGLFEDSMLPIAASAHRRDPAPRAADPVKPEPQQDASVILRRQSNQSASSSGAYASHRVLLKLNDGCQRRQAYGERPP